MQIAKYEILGTIGEGATAVVYHARDVSLARDVALKVLKPTLVADTNSFQRFAQEARLASQLYHPHIVPIFDMGMVEGHSYIAMRYIPGQSLDQIIRATGPLPVDETLKMAGQIGAALDYAHGLGMLHRDVKPSNILRSTDGDYLLTDFGLMRAMMQTGMTTHTGAILGTPPYIAPEIWTNQPASPATDLYALACVVFEALSGKPLFTGDTPPAIMTRHVLTGPDWSQGGPAVEPFLIALQQAVSKDPADRYSKVSAFATALEASLELVPTPGEVLEPPSHQDIVETIKFRNNSPSEIGVQTDLFLVEPALQEGEREKSHHKWLWPAIIGVLIIAVCLIGSIAILIPQLQKLTGGVSASLAPEQQDQSAVQIPLPTNTLPLPSPTDPQPVLVSTDTLQPTQPLPSPSPLPSPTAAIWPPTAVLRVNLGSYPDIIDPQKSSFVNEIAHLQLIYEGLTRLDANLQTVPGAAESWEYNQDATRLTFKLRQGLKYSDGSLLNAKRFEYAILRNIDPETAGEYAQITDEIAGASEWRSSDPNSSSYASLKSRVQVRALDNKGAPCADYEQADCLTLEVGLSKPAPYFHTVLTLWVAYPAKEELISEGGDNWWNSSKYQIGNGPFVLQNLEPSVRGYFIPNRNYWRGQATYNLEYAYITDTAVALEAYKNNEFDIVGLGAEDLATAQADPVLSKEANIYPGSCTFALMFHQLKEPFTDPKVREAFAYALDRETWVTDVLKGLGSPTLTWIPQGYPGFQEGETRFGYNPEKARQAIAESTYGSIQALPKITFTFSDTPRNRTRWEWLTAKYKEVLGVDIKLNPVESTTYTALTRDIETAPQIFLLGWCADYPDPQNWLSVYWKTGGFGERIGYSNSAFDALVNQADTTIDPSRRAELYAQAQDMLVGSAAVAFFWNNVNTYMVKPWVTGTNKTPQDSGFIGIQDPLSIIIDESLIP